MALKRLPLRAVGVLWPVAIILLAEISGRTPPSSATRSDVSSSWAALRGGFHIMLDVSIAPDGHPWACGGTGIATDDGSGWRVTEWRSCVAIDMDGPSSGWVVSSSDDGTNDGPPSALGRLERGKVVTVFSVPGVTWTDLAHTSASDVWASGYGADSSDWWPVFYHFDGLRWVDRSPARGQWRMLTAQVVAVDALGPTLGLALSKNGTVWRWDGASWHQWQSVPGIPDGASALDLDGLGQDDVWVVGGVASDWLPQYDVGFASHYDGDSWRTQLMQHMPLDSVAGSGADRAWAVGERGVMLELAGETWRLTGKTFMPLTTLTAVAATHAGSRAISVGSSFGKILELTANGFAILHGEDYDGRQLIYTVAPDGHGGLFTGGALCVPDNCVATPPNTTTLQTPIIWHWGLKGSRLDEALPSVRGKVASMSLRPPDDVWAVGDTYASDLSGAKMSGFVWRRVSARWVQIGEPTDVPLVLVDHGSDGSGWAIGVTSYEANAFSEVFQLGDDGARTMDRLGPGIVLDGLKVNAADDVWVGGTRYASSTPSAVPHALLRHYDGASWHEEPVDADGITALDVLPSGHGWLGAWADHLWTLFERVGGAWQARQQLTASIVSLRLLSQDTGYAGTGQGQVFRLEKGVWLPEWSEPNRFGGFPLELRGIAVVGGPDDDPTIAVAGECETLLVRSSQHPVPHRAYLPLARADYWRDPN